MKKSNKHSEMFFSSFIDDLNNSQELVSETLKECNLNEEEIANKARSMAGKLLAQMRISSAKQNKASLLQRAHELLNQVIYKVPTLNPHEKLYSLLNRNQNSPSFTFNNLKDLSSDDVLQMLSEVELLEVIEELESKKNQL